MTSKLEHLKSDLLAGLVVFLVAVPLCLGIALASGAPLFAGLTTGIIGGVVAGMLSGSQISVAGPAAGLTAIVLMAISTLGSYEVFLAAVIAAGLIQLVMGFARAGMISAYLPSNVIEGMLTAIGVIIIIKQVPHAAGWSGGAAQPAAVVITLVSLGLLVAWQRVPALQRIKALPGALAAVAAGVVINEVLRAAGSAWALEPKFLVNLPVAGSVQEFLGNFARPDLSALKRADVWVIGATVAAVASIETLLCIEAADKMDPLKRYTDTNRELKAQGVGNMLCGFLGGLPMTSVIVRTSANVQAGGRTKTATIAHGAYLLVAVLAIPALLNRIPLACLAAVLIMTGWKLANPAVFMHMWEKGKYQFVPFMVTVAAVVGTDLLKGVAIGLCVSILFILHGNMKLAYFFKTEKHEKGETVHIELAQEVSFLNKAAIKRVLSELPEKSVVWIHAGNTDYIDHDVLELIRDFLKVGSKEKGIKVHLSGFKKSYRLEDTGHVTSTSDEPSQKTRNGQPKHAAAAGRG